MPVPLDRIDLAPGVVAAFTGRDPRRGSVGHGTDDSPLDDPVGSDSDLNDPGRDGPSPKADPSGLADPANLAHHRPHVPSLLARARRSVADQLGVAVTDLHLMRQVHGADVATIGPDAPVGLEARGVDAMVTDQPGRALVVQAADCVPVLAAHDAGPVGVAHAGRAGVEQGVVIQLLEALARLVHEPTADPSMLRDATADPASGADRRADGIHVAVGPSIGGCCYEVPGPMAVEVREAVRRQVGDAAADVTVTTTTWGTTSLDLPAVVAATARAWGVADVRESPGCTRCGGDGRWFSHRRDPASGRHWGIVLRPHPTSSEVAA